MGSPCLVQVCWVGFRFVRLRCHPWVVLGSAWVGLLSESEGDRLRVRIRYMRAVSQINFVRVYEFLNDLLW